MAGVALFAAIALLRIVHGFSLRRWLAIACSLMLALTLPAPADFVSLAHDAGTPALDGLGPVGGGFHSEKEYLDLKTLTPRLYLLTKLIMDVGANPPKKTP